MVRIQEFARALPVGAVGLACGTSSGALNLLRVSRRATVNWRDLFAGCLGWIAISLGFGRVIGNVLDPRALIHAINAAVLQRGASGLSLEVSSPEARRAA